MNERDHSVSAQDLARIGTGLVELTAPVFERLRELAALAPQLQLDRAATDRRFPDEDVARLHDAVARSFDAEPLLVGAGLAASHEDAPGSAFAWWVRKEGEVVAKRHVLNPASDSYYDVAGSRWFRKTAARGAATLIGPYIDSWGTDDVTMTASLPAVVGEGLTAVVAADLDTRAYVSELERLLRGTSATAVVDAEDRVIVSSARHLETGTRLAAAERWTIRSRSGVDGLDWDVVSLDETSGGL